MWAEGIPLAPPQPHTHTGWAAGGTRIRSHGGEKGLLPLLGYCSARLGELQGSEFSFRELRILPLLQGFPRPQKPLAESDPLYSTRPIEISSAQQCEAGRSMGQAKQSKEWSNG